MLPGTSWCSKACGSPCTWDQNSTWQYTRCMQKWAQSGSGVAKDRQGRRQNLRMAHSTTGRQGQESEVVGGMTANGGDDDDDDGEER